MREEKKTKGKK